MKSSGWGPTHIALMLRILTWHKPTTLDEWNSSADAQEALLKFFGEEDGKGTRPALLKTTDRTEILLEKTPAKFMERAFNAAIVAPEKPSERPPILAAEARIAVELDAILKKMAEVPVEEKKPPAPPSAAEDAAKPAP